MDRLRVLLADDHPLFLEGLRAVLGARPDLEIVGQAVSGPEAVAQALSLLPDIVLMDIQMPGLSGIEAARRIVRASPHVGVIMLTMLEDDDSALACPELTDREREVLHFIARGLNNPAIAERLSPKTVSHHISNIFSSPTSSVSSRSPTAPKPSSARATPASAASIQPPPPAPHPRAGPFLFMSPLWR